MKNSIAFRKNYLEKDIISDIENFFINLHKTNEKILLVCIGTDLSTYDVAGPYIGSEIKDKISNFEIIGDLNNLVNAKNVKEIAKIVNQDYSDYTVVAIDSMATSEEDIGTISISNSPCSPGKGASKDLGEIGDYTIGIMNVNEDTVGSLTSYCSIRFGFTYNMCVPIIKAIINADKQIDCNKKQNEFEDLMIDYYKEDEKELLEHAENSIYQKK